MPQLLAPHPSHFEPLLPLFLQLLLFQPCCWPRQLHPLSECHLLPLCCPVPCNKTLFVWKDKMHNDNVDKNICATTITLQIKDMLTDHIKGQGATFPSRQIVLLQMLPIRAKALLLYNEACFHISSLPLSICFDCQILPSNIFLLTNLGQCMTSIPFSVYHECLASLVTSPA